MRVEAGRHWADIKDVDDLVGADQDRLEDALGLVGQLDKDGQVDKAAIMASIKVGYPMIHRVRDALFSVVILDWSLGAPLPRDDPDFMQRVPLALKQAIEEATEEHNMLLNRRPDPKGASGATTRSSNGSSKAPHPRRTA